MKVWNTQPCEENYASGLLTTLRERVESLEELQLRITEDKTLSDRVRNQAFEWAEEFWTNREAPIKRKPKSAK